MSDKPLKLDPDTGLLPKDIIKADDQSSWETAWQKGVIPWDMGASQPSLIEVIESSGLDFPRKGRALVPGCGTGYDLVYLSKALGLESVGLEIAETAIRRANDLITKAKKIYPDLKASISSQDFFAYDPPTSELFDVIYDHTFFCVIPPTTRSAWARKMTKLLKPGGFLIISIYPILPYTETGPPYYIRSEHYEELLSTEFRKVLDKVPEAPSPSHEGKERIVVWKKW